MTHRHRSAPLRPASPGRSARGITPSLRSTTSRLTTSKGTTSGRTTSGLKAVGRSTLGFAALALVAAGLLPAAATSAPIPAPWTTGGEAGTAEVAASGWEGAGSAPTFTEDLRTSREDTLGARGRVDREALLEAQRSLAHDSMEGRRTGTAGSERARRYLVEAFDQAGFQVVGGQRSHPFTVTPRGGGEPLEGVNIIGLIPGSVHPERYLVVTAHYDHLGIRDGEIYNGADDNASGTAAILNLGRWLRANPPRHSVLLVAFDAEEMGLQGARAFIADPPVPLDRVVMNLNLDMVSRNEADELYAAGTYHYPFLVPHVEAAAELSRIQLLMGHDRPDLPPGDDWTMSSDHGPFHQAGIPFLYFGVEDHPGYHNPSDVFEDITPDFYLEAVETILDLLLIVDRNGEGILAARGGAGG